jgi:hypothetical protein
MRVSGKKDPCSRYQSSVAGYGRSDRKSNQQCSNDHLGPFVRHPTHQKPTHARYEDPWQAAEDEDREYKDQVGAVLHVLRSVKVVRRMIQPYHARFCQTPGAVQSL